MEQIISKEIARKLMEMKGKSRGMAVKDDFEYVFREKGEEGVRKLEDELARVGYPIKYGDLKTMSFYPVGLEGLIMLAVKKLFNYDKKELKKLGEFSSKLPLIVMIFMKYFVSIEKIIKGTPKMWRRYHTVGDPKVVEFSKEKKYGILRIENFDLIPSYCQMLTGYLSSVIQIVVKAPVTCEEIKCTFEGDKYHEFLIKW